MRRIFQFKKKRKIQTKKQSNKVYKTGKACTNSDRVI